MKQITWLEDGNGNKCSPIKHLLSLLSKPTDECVLWDGYTENYGYGRIWYKNRNTLVHRVSFELKVGNPAGHVVRHSCDNPLCINPKHLTIGTQLDNIKDRNQRGRTAVGENVGSAKLSERDVLLIRSSSISTRKLGAMFGISSSSVSNIKNKISWRHLL